VVTFIIVVFWVMTT